MDALTQAEVFALIGELNGFIEKWDPRLVTQEREYQAKRTRIIAENNAEKTRREKAYKQECETLSRQSAKMIEDAQKILEDVDQMDQQLMSSDKYYSKTKTRKEAELAGVESQAYRNYTALMEGIEAIRRDYGQISKKYRESMLPFLINDLHFLFSAQRKKDYESLIVLRNTVHKFVNEVSELLPEITQDELTMKKEAFEQDQKTLALNFLSTIQEFDNQESIKNKSDEKQLQRELDELFPQEFVDFLAQTGMDYESRRVKVNSGKNFADSGPGPSHYSPAEHGVYYNAAEDEKNVRGAGATYYHELGHMIDHVCMRYQNLMSENAVFHHALVSDGQRLIQCYNNSTPEQRERAVRNLCEGAWHSCSDLANFATNGHVCGGWGHSEEYCARAWAMEHEAFAHFFEASMGDSIKLQRLTKLFPNSVRVFNQMLDAIIKNAEPYDREQRERAIWEER